MNFENESGPSKSQRIYAIFSCELKVGQFLDSFKNWYPCDVGIYVSDLKEKKQEHEESTLCEQEQGGQIVLIKDGWLRLISN